MITSHLMCANFFMINLNVIMDVCVPRTSAFGSYPWPSALRPRVEEYKHPVIITFMLKLFNNNRETLAKHVTC